MLQLFFTLSFVSISTKTPGDRTKNKTKGTTKAATVFLSNLDFIVSSILCVVPKFIVEKVTHLSTKTHLKIMTDHQWYKIIVNSKMYKECIKCKKRIKHNDIPRLVFAKESVYEKMVLDFWTPPKEKSASISKKKQWTVPSHFIAFKQAQYVSPIVPEVQGTIVIDKFPKKKLKKLKMIKDPTKIEEDYIKIEKTIIKK